MANIIEKAAKSGWLGTRAKVSGETNTADWSTKPVKPKDAPQPANQLEAMKRRQSKFGV
jgi:hypothetical protein